MHELSVTQGILKICLEEGEKHNVNKVSKLNIKVGELTGLVPSCIDEYFKIVAKGTIADGAELNIEKVKVEIKCSVCEYEGILGKDNYLCPKCKGNNYKITKGKEFYLDTMEVD